ncbi:MAG: hypothetical protein M3O71_10070 [Bacteroidota bacterium]|nr:hypothetical protein [Bacteroidota bacterium]
MRKRLISEKQYPFAWLDEVTEVTLNPQKGNLDQLKADELRRTQHQFEAEVRQIISSLKAQTFWIYSVKKKKAVLQQYAEAIRLVKIQAVFNLDHYPENSILKSTGSAIIAYLDELSHTIENRYTTYLPEMMPAGQKATIPDAGIFKIICNLSVDQMGIILKAADDVRLLVSRSLSMVFKSIVPYLSTKNKSELSWDSMRSNSYHPEESDKEAAIAALEKLIKKIRDY